MKNYTHLSTQSGCVAKKLAVVLSLVTVWAFQVAAANADEFRLVPSIGLRQEYDDNLFFDDNDEEDDFITTVSPGLELVEKTGRFDADILARIDALSYAKNDDLNYQDQDYSGRFSYRLTPRMAASARAQFRKDSRRDRDILETGLVIGNAIRERQCYGASAEFIFSEKTMGTLSYDYNQDDFDDPEFSNYSSHNVSLGFVHDISDYLSSTAARMNLGYARYDYPESLSATIDNYTFTLGASHDISEVLKIFADVGTRYTESEFETLVSRYETIPVVLVPGLDPIMLLFQRIGIEEKKSDGWGAIGQVALSYQGEVTHCKLTIFRDIMAASGRSGTVERTALTFNISRRFTEKIRGNLYAGYYLNENDREEMGGEKIDEQTLAIGPGIRYDITTDLALEASYSYNWVDDKADEKKAERNRVFFRIIYQYPLFE